MNSYAMTLHSHQISTQLNTCDVYPSGTNLETDRASAKVHFSSFGSLWPPDSLISLFMLVFATENQTNVYLQRNLTVAALERSVLLS